MEDAICTLTAATPEDLPPAATLLLESFPEERIFAFLAPMGAGKTTFIKALCHHLHVQEEVVSPTFALINEYASPHGAVYHFDFYRLKNAAEAYDIGTDEYLSSGCYCFLEWPQVMQEMLPERYVQVDITVDAATGARQIRARIVNQNRH
ncbi:MAG: tRNA (adenosine(37)-N6)-threonylcarbamoyltransferase complex ATPase subunit type 1 TsaE [Bacteroides sp.]|nr:tRNA (adenosine(37)-N6)-threonylcarbamoyltransferase complex ATPase subunit type 1 TsaE [Ruminococcus flavefaciens]MCM1555451.1 tRNA (adenosine(37)-N6)-threonylcarbamoyltransferase complex ATPase subunit type 1 TsaE [Bacteroides sp.]